jgi:hypothetical protein
MALVTSFMAGLRPTQGTTAPMFYTILATLGGCDRPVGPAAVRVRAVGSLF